MLAEIWRRLFPPRISDEVIAQAQAIAGAAVEDARKVEDRFQRIANDAAAAGVDPWQMFVHEHKGATFRRHVAAQAQSDGKD